MSSSRTSVTERMGNFRDSIKWKKKQKEVKIELFRVQMRQMIGKSFGGPLIKDYHAHTNFRAVLEFEMDNMDNGKWALSNQYASKGTVSGYITANVILKGLNTVEHKVMKYKKRTADTLVSLFMYLGHERKVSKDPVADMLDQSLTERRAAWGLISSDSYNMIHQRYTYVLGRRKKDEEYQFVMALKTRCLGVDDIYAKHGTLVDSQKYNVEAAGEMTVHYIQNQDFFVLCLDNDSGTFRPSIPHINRCKHILENILNADQFMKHYNWKVVLASRPQCLPKNGLPLHHVDELFKNYDAYMSTSFPQAAEQREDILTIQNASASDLGFE